METLWVKAKELIATQFSEIHSTLVNVHIDHGTQASIIEKPHVKWRKQLGSQESLPRQQQVCGLNFVVYLSLRRLWHICVVLVPDPDRCRVCCGLTEMPLMCWTRACSSYLTTSL